ncbi:ankyrin repeat-containing domain protein [Xylaria sp. FL1777]|nr:ankyrin repeat-containing domain protein [Xylaria sp. FL1777]
MADHSAEQILERRREQNREAQRRFREKKTLQKTLEVLHPRTQPSGALGTSLLFEPSPDSSLALSSYLFPETDAAVITTSAGGWDPAMSDDMSLLGFNTPPDDSISQLPKYPTRRGLLTPRSSVGTPVERPSNTTEISLSPASAGLEPPHEPRPSPKPDSPVVRNSRGWLSPLHMAAKKGSSRIIRMLLQHNSDCNERDSEGLTPLIHAVIGGNEEAVLLLLENGARIDYAHWDDNRPCSSAIHWAVLKRRESVLRVLLDHASSDSKLVNSYDDLGRAPLHIAIDMEFDAGVSLLLQSGADPSQKADNTTSGVVDVKQSVNFRSALKD